MFEGDAARLVGGEVFAGGEFVEVAEGVGDVFAAEEPKFHLSVVEEGVG